MLFASLFSGVREIGLLEARKSLTSHVGLDNQTKQYSEILKWRLRFQRELNLVRSCFLLALTFLVSFPHGTVLLAMF